MRRTIRATAKTFRLAAIGSAGTGALHAPATPPENPAPDKSWTQTPSIRAQPYSWSVNLVEGVALPRLPGTAEACAGPRASDVSSGGTRSRGYPHGYPQGRVRSPRRAAELRVARLVRRRRACRCPNRLASPTLPPAECVTRAERYIPLGHCAALLSRATHSARLLLDSYASQHASTGQDTVADAVSPMA